MSEMPTPSAPALLPVEYSCDDCGLHRQRVEVPERGAEDIVAWMDATMRLVARDHDRRSPNCNPHALADLRIPMKGRVRVGGPVIQ